MLKNNIEKIEFIDLQAQRNFLGDSLNQGIQKVLNHCGFVLGPEVTEFEEQLSQYTNAKECITCSSGTDALTLLLMALNVGPGDAVFVPTFTFASTAEVVAQLNATPIFIDICEETFNMDPESLLEALAQVKKTNLKPKGIIAVDMFGLPADYPSLQKLAERENLWLMADAAQSFGGGIGNQKVGNLVNMTTTSFFPSKPLACYGDGGAIFTQDVELGKTLRSLRNHGQGKQRYEHIHIGLNSRLDSLQAAILKEKLRIFEGERKRREQIAALYQHGLKNVVKTPHIPEGFTHAWGLYTIRCESEKERNFLAEYLTSMQVPNNVYYRKPLHAQPVYQHFPRATQNLIKAEESSRTVLSLPMHPYLTDAQVEYIIGCVNKAFL